VGPGPVIQNGRVISPGGSAEGALLLVGKKKEVTNQGGTEKEMSRGRAWGVWMGQQKQPLLETIGNWGCSVTPNGAARKASTCGRIPIKIRTKTGGGTSN